MESNAFTYHALDSHTDEIRLISLEPSDLSQADAQVACTLITAKLSENPKYEALSYVWGSLSTSATITVDGQSLVVGENLWQALKQLRLCASRRTIWIDAICINQANTTERNHQVSQMSRIYSCAEQVLAWLGPGIGFSDQAMRFLAEVADGAIPSIECDKPIFKEFWNAVEYFCESEYWKRLWIIQEVVLARKVLVMWGAAIIPLTAFHDVCKKTQSLKLFRSWNYRVIQQLTETPPAKLSLRRSEAQIQGGTRATLLDLMATFLDAACKDEKDQIFGLLSLSRSCCRDAMPVEYSRSAYDLYNKAFYHHVECHLSVSSSDKDKASILMLRYRLHRKSKEHPKRLISDLISTIIFTGPLNNLSRRSDGDDLCHPWGNLRTTWTLPYHYTHPRLGWPSLLGLESIGIGLYRDLPIVSPPRPPATGSYLKTTQVRSFLADDGTLGFVPPSVMVGDQIFRSSDRKSLYIRRLDSSGSWIVIATALQRELDRYSVEGASGHLEFKL